MVLPRQLNPKVTTSTTGTASRHYQGIGNTQLGSRNINPDTSLDIGAAFIYALELTLRDFGV